MILSCQCVRGERQVARRATHTASRKREFVRQSRYVETTANAVQSLWSLFTSEEGHK